MDFILSYFHFIRRKVCIRYNFFSEKIKQFTQRPGRKVINDLLLTYLTNWLIDWFQDPYLKSEEYGQTIDEVENLIKKHEAFEKAAAAQEERFAALERLTTVRETTSIIA